MIRFRQLMLCAAVAMVLIVGLAIPAAAQTTWDKKTRITINVPVRVGNVVLPAGKYVMRLHDDAGNRRVVHIFNADETKLYTTTFGIPDFRTNATNEPAITFYEADPGRPPALRSWFYAASNFGLEFLDTRGPVQQIASTPEPIPAPPAQEPAIAEVEPVVEETAPAEPVIEIARNEPPPVQEPEPTLPPELPKTAGALSLLALGGLISLGVSFSLKRFLR